MRDSFGPPRGALRAARDRRAARYQRGPPIRCALVLILVAAPLGAQELEPRALINAPVGTNFALISTGYLFGNVLLDPALPIEDGSADVWTFAASYARAIDFFGLGAKIGVGVPFAAGTWTARIGGMDTSTSRAGLGDPVFRLAVNFIGSPALSAEEFRGYRQKTVAGVILAVTAPLGQYYPERLVNLGTNRWSIGTRLGLSHNFGTWIVEGYATGTFYTRNDDFYGGNVLEQHPLIDGQLHVIRFLGSPLFWIAGSAGYAWGGRSIVNGVEKEPLDNKRLSLALRKPFGRQHAIKLAYINGLATRLGTDFDTFQVAWQYAW
jgi:hypothetical protein